MPSISMRYRCPCAVGLTWRTRPYPGAACGRTTSPTANAGASEPWRASAHWSSCSDRAMTRCPSGVKR
jgi:hypothetical protein